MSMITSSPEQVGGNHYAESAIPCIHCGKPLMHWDVYNSFPYLIANATKYLWRFRFKNGFEDMEKAITYVIKAVRIAYPKNKIKGVDDQKGVMPDGVTGSLVFDRVDLGNGVIVGIILLGPDGAPALNSRLVGKR